MVKRDVGMVKGNVRRSVGTWVWYRVKLLETKHLLLVKVKVNLQIRLADQHLAQ